MKYDRYKFMNENINQYISLFYPELNKNLKKCTVLEIGSGIGMFANSLAPYVKNYIGIDLNQIKLILHKKMLKKTTLTT